MVVEPNRMFEIELKALTADLTNNLFCKAFWHYNTVVYISIS